MKKALQEIIYNLEGIASVDMTVSEIQVYNIAATALKLKNRKMTRHNKQNSWVVGFEERKNAEGRG